MALEKRTVWIMAGACGVSVANLYYSQPLLADIGRTLGVTPHRIGYLPTFTQAGTALGMFTFVPLGDMFERRRLIVTMCVAIGCSDLMMSIAPNLVLVDAAGFATGLTTIVPHLILPFAAKLSPEEGRGRVLGIILSGLLIGILLARVVSGYTGSALGWRPMYQIAAVTMFVLAAVLRVTLPRDTPEARLRYRELLASILDLARTQPVLREAAITGGTLFGAFSSFWTTLVFFLGTPPYHYGAKTAGLFGLVGAAGAAIAPAAGRLSDRRGPALTVSLAILVSLLAFVVFAAAGTQIWGLVLGVVLLDLGVQACHVANQTRIYPLMPEARSRLNTVYMVSYFLGGSLGSALGAYGWSRAGWMGVCAAGSMQILVAGAARAFARRS
jgi:predicted MFS family arabinose efflux permease